MTHGQWRPTGRSCLSLYIVAHLNLFMPQSLTLALDLVSPSLSQPPSICFWELIWICLPKWQTFQTTQAKENRTDLGYKAFPVYNLNLTSSGSSTALGVDPGSSRSWLGCSTSPWWPPSSTSPSSTSPTSASKDHPSLLFQRSTSASPRWAKTPSVGNLTREPSTASFQRWCHKRVLL